MNHDIIAAGHPALYFDMAVYHEAYPKHWRDAEQNGQHFRAQLWFAGQIAAADSGLELIESRANKTLSVSTWPELSNYQCNSCHMTLNGIPKSAKASDRDLVVKGRAPVRNWNLAGLAALSTTSGDQLRELLIAPNPDPKRVAAETKRIRVQLLESLFDTTKISVTDWSRQRQIQLTISRLEETKRSDSWETAANAYIAAWATCPKTLNGKLNVALKTMRNGLLFPKELMTPNYPRMENGLTSPTLEEWNDSLQQAVSALNHEERR